MKRGLFFILLLSLTACQADLPTTPQPPMVVRSLPATDPLVQLLDETDLFSQLSGLVGWVDRDRPYYATDSVHEVVLFNLEAEDEHRTLVTIFRDRQLIASTIIGYAPNESCPEGTSEETATDGYVFVYDLTQGLRCLMNYFTAESLTSSEELPTDQGHSLDLLTHDAQRQCLSSYLQRQPRGLNCHLLTELEMLPRMQYVADDVSQILSCLD